MAFAPDADIYETEEAFVVKLDMPGAQKDSLNLLLESKRLIIRGEVSGQFQEQGRILYCEILKKKYYREFNLGNGIQMEKIVAQFDGGVLTVTLPKNEEVKSREIHIL